MTKHPLGPTYAWFLCAQPSGRNLLCRWHEAMGFDSPLCYFLTRWRGTDQMAFSCKYKVSFCYLMSFCFTCFSILHSNFITSVYNKRVNNFFLSYGGIRCSPLPGFLQVTLSLPSGSSTFLAHTPRQGLPPGCCTFPWPLLPPAGSIEREFNDPGWQREKKATAASPVVKRLREAQPHHPSELRRQYLISIVTLGQSLLWAYFLIFKTVFEIHKIGFIVIVDGSFIHLRIHEANTMSNTKAWEK